MVTPFEELASIIDDIDTASDAHRPERTPYVERVYALVERARAVFVREGWPEPETGADEKRRIVVT